MSSSNRTWWQQLVERARGFVAVSEGEWTRRLGNSLIEAERTDGEYRAVISVLRRQEDQASRRGDSAGLARAVWSMALVELHVGHSELAEGHVRRGLRLLAGAEPMVQRLATANVLQRMLSDSRPEAWTKTREALLRDAVVALAESAPVWSLRLMAGIAAVLLDVARPDECIAICDAAFAQRTATGNPYRVSADVGFDDAHEDGDHRETLVYMICLRARAHERVAGYERALDSIRQGVTLLGGISDSEARTIAWLRGSLAYLDGRYADAERELGVALGPDVDLLLHHYARDAALDALGWTYLEMGMLAEAGGVAKRMGELDSQSARPAALRARVELERGKLTLAQDSATQALACASLSVARTLVARQVNDWACATAALVLAEIASRSGDPDAARAHGSTALARARSVHAAGDLALLDAITVMAIADAKCGGNEAEDLFREGLALRCRPDHPKRARTLRAYAAFLRERQRDEEAAAAEAAAEAIAWPSPDHMPS